MSYAEKFYGLIEDYHYLKREIHLIEYDIEDRVSEYCAVNPNGYEICERIRIRLGFCRKMKKKRISNIIF